MQSFKLTTVDGVGSSCLKTHGSSQSYGRDPYLVVSVPSMIVFKRVVNWLLVDEIELAEKLRLLLLNGGFCPCLLLFAFEM